MPDDAYAKHHITRVDHGQAGVRDHHESSMFTGSVIIRVVVEMISAKVQRVIDLNILLRNDLAVLHNLQFTYIVSDNPLVAQQKLIVMAGRSAPLLRDVPVRCTAVGVFDPDLESRIGARAGVIDRHTLVLFK